MKRTCTTLFFLGVLTVLGWAQMRPIVSPGGGTGGGAPADATYLTQTANGSLSAEQALSTLATGLMQVTTKTGAVTSVTTSAGIAGLLSDETGSGLLMFDTAPTFATSLSASDSAAIRTHTENASTLLFQAYDVNDAEYTTFMTLTAGNAPSLSIPILNGNTALYGNLEVAAGQFFQQWYPGGNVTEATTAIDWANGNNQKFELKASTTFTFANPQNGAKYTVMLTQENSQNWTVDYPATVVWPRGVKPTMSTGDGDIDICSFVYSSVNTKYYGACSQLYTTGSPVAGPFDASPLLAMADPSGAWVGEKTQNLGALSSGFLYGTVASSKSTISAVGTTGTGTVALNTSPVFATNISTPSIITGTDTELDIAPNGTGKIKFSAPTYNVPAEVTIEDGTTDVSFADTNIRWMTCTESTELKLAGGVTGGRYMIEFRGDGGACAISWDATTTPKWPAATGPTITTTNGAVSFVLLYYNGTSWIGEYAVDHR